MDSVLRHNKIELNSKKKICIRLWYL